MQKKYLSALAILLIFSACSVHFYKTKPMDIPYNYVWKAAILTVNQDYGIQKVNSKRRVVISNFFKSKPKDKDSSQRSQVYVQVSRDRPYKAEVLVKVQRAKMKDKGKTKKKYYHHGHDDVLAKKIALKIFSTAVESWDKKTIFDEKPF